MGELKRTVFKGVVWSAVDNFSVIGVRFVVMIFMARLLMPSDYGVIGMLSIFLAVSSALISAGFSQALIRKQDRTEVDNCTVFYFNFVVSLILYLVLFFSAPLIAKFYNMPLLTSVTRVVGISLVLNSLIIVQGAIMTAEVNFKTIAVISLSQSVVSGVVGIFLAFKGFGPWALVGQTLVASVISAILFNAFSKWHPKWMFSMKSFRELFSFGSKLLLSGLLDVTYNNIRPLLIGKMFSPAELGHFTRAQNFAELPSSNINSVIQRVSYPVLCRVQDSDRLPDIYRKFLKLLAFVIFPMMLGLSALSKPVVFLLVGPQWGFCSEILAVICLYMMWLPIHSINLNLLQVKGRTDLFLRLEIIKKTISITVLVISLRYGIIAMCWGSLFTSIVSLTVNTYYTGKLIQVGFFRQMRDVFPTMLLSLAMAVLIYGTTRIIDGNGLQLMVGASVGILFYISVSYLFKFPELKEIYGLVRKRGKN